MRRNRRSPCGRRNVHCPQGVWLCRLFGRCFLFLLFFPFSLPLLVLPLAFLRFKESRNRRIIKNAPVDYPMNSGVLRHSIVTGVICPIGYENIFLALYPVLINGQRRSTMLIFLYHFPDFSKHLKLVSICRSQLQTSGKALMQ